MNEGKITKADIVSRSQVDFILEKTAKGQYSIKNKESGQVLEAEEISEI